MRLQELFETTEEDRALISLSSEIYKSLTDYAYDFDYDDDINEIINVGKIGDLYDTPIPALDSIEIEIQSDEQIWLRAGKKPKPDRDPNKEYISGIWVPDNNAIVFNHDHLLSNKMKTTVMHELRHAFDDAISDYRAGDSKKYFPYANKDKYSDKEEKDNNDAAVDVSTDDKKSSEEYLAQPGEINARFVEVLHSMINEVKLVYRVLPPNEIKKRLFRDLKLKMEMMKIPQQFKHGTNSTHYKRLISRAIDMLEKETKYYESVLAKQGTPKVATGSW